MTKEQFRDRPLRLFGALPTINLESNSIAKHHYILKHCLIILPFQSHKDYLRNTIFEDEDEDEQLNKLETNVKVLAETLASYIYNLPLDNSAGSGEIFTGSMAITKDSIRPWLQVRSSQHNNDLKNAFEKYLKNVKVSYDKPDAREPDFMLYDERDGLLNIYNVKPAVFDLFLTFMIVAYLAVIYLAIFHFPKLYTFVCHLTVNKVKVN